MQNSSDSKTKSDKPIETVQWSKTTRYIVAVFFVFALIGLVVFVSPIARNLAAALLFAFLLDILIRIVSHHTPLSYRWSALVLYMILYIIMAGLLLVGWRYLVDYLQGVMSSLQAAATNFLQAFQSQPESVSVIIPAIPAQIADTFSRLLGAAVKALVGILALPAAAYINFAVVVVNIGFFIFLSNLLVFSAYGARGGLKRWVPDALSRELTLLLTWLDQIWGNYLAGMGLFAIVLGAGSAVEFWLLGVPYPALFGALTGLICLLPLIGGFLSGFIVFIPCLLLGSSRFTTMDPLVFAILVTLINDIICQVSYNFVALPIIGKLVKLPYWVTLAGVMMGFAFGNILFAFLVIPLFSTIRLVYTYFLAKIVGLEPFPGLEKPMPPAKGFLSQFLIDEKVQPPE